MAELIKQLAVEIAELVKLDNNPKVMTTEEVASCLRTTEDEVRRMARAGELPYLKIGAKGSGYRFNRDAINRAMGV